MFKQGGVGNANIYNNCFENLKTEKKKFLQNLIPKQTACSSPNQLALERIARRCEDSEV